MLQLANNKRHGYIATIQVKCDPSRAQSLHFQLIEDTESVKMAWFIRPRLTYFSFASCHVNIDHHDTLHVTLHTRPSCFSACNIEKLEMGLGTRLHNIILDHTCNKWCNLIGPLTSSIPHKNPCNSIKKLVPHIKTYVYDCLQQHTHNVIVANRELCIINAVVKRLSSISR